MSKIKFRNGSAVEAYCPFPEGTYLHCTYNPNVEWPETTWVQQGQGNYLVSSGATYISGNAYGSNTHVLTVAQLPSHSHPVNDVLGTGYNPVGGGDKLLYNSVPAGRKAADFFSIGNTGSGQAHNNMPQSIAAPLWLRTE